MATLAPTLTPTPSPWASLPPGQYLVYRYRKGQSEISYNVISVDGALQREVATSNYEGWLSPDTKQVFICERDASDRPSIPELVNLEIGSIIRLSGGEEYCGQTAWASDGLRLAIALGGNGIEIAKLSRGEIELEGAIQPFGMPPTGERVWQPVWSPNGKWIAFHITYDRLNDPWGGLYVTDTGCMTIDMCKAMTYSLGPKGFYGTRAWTADNELALVEKPGIIRIYNVETRQVVHTLRADFEFQPEAMAWSPDGNWVALSAGGVLLIPTHGGDSKILLEDEGYFVEGWLTIPAR